MEVVKKIGQLQLRERGAGITLTDERQLDRIIAGPETPLFEGLDENYESKSLYKDTKESLLSRVKAGAERSATNMSIAYDFFFGGTTRHNYPSDDITIKAFKVVHDTAKKYGMTFEASILSPLDVGGGWIKQSDETGFSCQYLETEIAPDGSYSVDMVGQRQWCNNKGPIRLTPHQVLVYAFNEERVGDGPYFYVDENAIINISDTASYIMETDKEFITGAGYGTCPLHISGKWENPTANRALCVMVYRTPELDYFADSAHTFMKKLLDDHNAAGISYHAFYSDEMHIQFDWDLSAHFGETEINVRYVTPALAKVFAEKYGEKYLDFTKYLVYMSYHQHDFLPGEAGKENAQHVFGKTPLDICNTWLFRNRYFELLQRTVVDLSKEAKAYAETLWGGPILTQAHATWQESPTCDHVSTVNIRKELGEEYEGITRESPIEDRVRLREALAAKEDELGVSHYDYTPLYDWSASIRENISACYDYFKWNEFLTGSGSDHAENPIMDRTYYSQALVASFAELNDFEKSYCACWGMPGKLMDMFGRVTIAYGVGQAGPVPHHSEATFVNGLGTRRTDVLALYPIKLNNVEERFGSWMVQYGYCNYVTEEKLLENATVTQNGTLCIKGQEFRCLVVMFEPFLEDKTFALLEEYLAAGGKVVWMSMPALTNAAGEDASERFRNIFGLKEICSASEGEKRQGAKVSFTGKLAGIKEMTIPTDFIVDMVYPCVPDNGAESAAELDGKTVAVYKPYEKGGLAVYAGFRVRDDQSGSLGEDIDTLYRMLMKIEAYRPNSLEARGREPGSRYVYNTFADGSVAIAPHFRQIREAWEGPFYRDKEYDDAVLARRPDIGDPVVEIDEEIAGHAIRFSGEEVLAYRLDDVGAPVSFFSVGADGIEVDGRKYTYADRKAKFEFTPVPDRFRADGLNSVTLVTCWTEGAVLTIPAAGEGTPKVLGCKWDMFDASIPVEHRWDGRSVSFTVTPELVGTRVAIVF
ncbi:MAG: hypothetical protein IJE08_07930 [Clostridia bacterium]|nr:hypothetical protein [Clostridia bacterium]